MAGQKYFRHPAATRLKAKEMSLAGWSLKSISDTLGIKYVTIQAWKKAEHWQIDAERNDAAVIAMHAQETEEFIKNQKPIFLKRQIDLAAQIDAAVEAKLNEMHHIKAGRDITDLEPRELASLASTLGRTHTVASRLTGFVAAGTPSGRSAKPQSSIRIGSIIQVGLRPEKAPAALPEPKTVDVMDFSEDF